MTQQISPGSTYIVGRSLTMCYEIFIRTLCSNILHWQYVVIETDNIYFEKLLLIQIIHLLIFIFLLDISKTFETILIISIFEHMNSLF